MMKTPIALHNLWHQRIKTCVSVGGVAFALLLVFMQLGFMGAVSYTATNLLEHLQFDILLRARDYVHLYEPGQIDRRMLTIAENTPGVAQAVPLWITLQNWRTLPTYQQSSTPATDSGAAFEVQYLPIAVMAYQPEQCPVNVPEVQAASSRLLASDVVLLDDSTQAPYGPWTGDQFSEYDIDRETEIGGQRFRIGGLFHLGTGLAANGAVLTSHRGFGRITPWDINSTTSLGLIQLSSRDPQTRAEVLAQLQQRLQWMVDVLSKEQALQREQLRWLWQTPLGLIFQMGVLLSLLVGAAIVYMVLATDVANRLPEYATLLAMGYSRLYLAGIVMTQAAVLCALGFAAAWGGAELLYRLTYSLSGIPLFMEPQRIVWVALLGIVMSGLSGLLALRKLWRAEPANLF